MNKQADLSGSEALFMLFPVLRRVVYEAFDMHNVKITRTQQIILVTMYCSDTLSMSELARRITTSNEQATRAVTQLVALGLIRRFQNEHNHRIVNIQLTDNAKAYVSEVAETADKLAVEYIGGRENAKKAFTSLTTAARCLMSNV